MIFCFNDEKNINPILLDRIHVIRVPSPDTNMKNVIARKYLLKEICPNIGINPEDIILPEDVCKQMIQKYCKNDKGVRKLKGCLETLCLKLNTASYMDYSQKYKHCPKEIVYPFTFTTELVNEFLGEKTEDDILSHYFL